MFNPSKICSFLFLSLVFLSCSKSNKDLPESVGKLGTLVVASDTGTHNYLNFLLDKVFIEDDDAYTGGSPFTELLKPSPNEFYEFFSNQKSVMVLVTASNKNELKELLEPFSDEEIEKAIQSSSAEYKEASDLFARYQHIVYVFAQDKKLLSNKLLALEKKLRKLLVDHEIQDQFAKIYDQQDTTQDYEKDMKRELGMSFSVPEGFKLVEHKNGFWWFELNDNVNNTPRKIGLIAHTYPYKDSLYDYTYSSICANRDSTIKYHIKGEIKGTYMGTSESDAYPARRLDMVSLNQRPFAKVRAWWNVDGIMMSGPFLRYITRVPGTQKIFAFEGFIYKPTLDVKEKDLRIVESVALSIK